MSACLLSYARTSHPVADEAASPQSDAGRFRNVRERPASSSSTMTRRGIRPYTHSRLGP